MNDIENIRLPLRPRKIMNHDELKFGLITLLFPCIYFGLAAFYSFFFLFLPGFYRRLADQNTLKVVCRSSTSSTIKAQLYAHSSSVRQKRTRD